MMFGRVNFTDQVRGDNEEQKSLASILFRKWGCDPGREEMFRKLCEKNEKFYEGCRKDQTALFLTELEYSIIHNKNLIAMMESPQGEGKSRIALWVIAMWLIKWWNLRQKQVNYDVTFNQAKTQSILPKLQDGDILLQDEDSQMKGEGKNTAKDDLQNLVETMRFTQKSIIICAPHITLLPGMTMLLRPFGQYRAYFETKNPADMRSRALWYQLQEDLSSGTRRFVLLGYIKMDLAVTTPMYAKYEELKEKNYRELEKNRGGVGARSKDALKYWTKIAGKVLRIALKEGWPDTDPPSKSGLDPAIMAAEVHSSKSEDKLLRLLVVRLYAKLKSDGKLPGQGGKKTQDQDPVANAPTIDPTQQFTWDETKEEQLLQKVKQESHVEDVDRAIKVYKAVRDHYKTQDPSTTMDALGEEYGCSVQNINKIAKGIESHLNNLIGHEYEPYAIAPLKTRLELDSLVSGGKDGITGGIGEIDLIGKKGDVTYLISVKCYNIKPSRASYSVKYVDACNPEVIEAIRLTKLGQPVKVLIHLLNRQNQQVYEKWVEPSVYLSPEPKAKWGSRTFLVHYKSPFLASPDSSGKTSDGKKTQSRSPKKSKPAKPDPENGDIFGDNDLDLKDEDPNSDLVDFGVEIDVPAEDGDILDDLDINI